MASTPGGVPPCYANTRFQAPPGMKSCEAVRAEQEQHHVKDPYYFLPDSLPKSSCILLNLIPAIYHPEKNRHTVFRRFDNR
jgi:hypothetical protein